MNVDLFGKRLTPRGGLLKVGLVLMTTNVQQQPTLRLPKIMTPKNELKTIYERIIEREKRVFY